MIFQVTNGCSWNRCSYCEMYTDAQKKFRPRAEAELLAEIRACGESGLEPRRVFLADGDALVLSMRRLAQHSHRDPTRAAIGEPGFVLLPAVKSEK